MKPGFTYRLGISLALLLPFFSLACSFSGNEAPQETTSPGTNSSFGISGIVEYTAHRADGTVLRHGVVHNTVNAEALDETFARLIEDAAGQTDGYHVIAALSVDAASDDPSDGIDAASLSLLLDGNGSLPGDQNPSEGSVSPPSDGSGQGTISVTFTARDATSVKQIALTKAPESDTATGPGPGSVADTDILSYLDVPDVSLNGGDSVTYVWTINVD